MEQIINVPKVQHIYMIKLYDISDGNVTITFDHVQPWVNVCRGTWELFEPTAYDFGVQTVSLPWQTCTHGWTLSNLILHSTDDKPPLQSTYGKAPLQDIPKLKYPADTSGDMSKPAPMQKSKNISSADKAKITSMVKALSKYKNIEEDSQVMFTSTGNAKQPRKKGTGIDCEIEESVQSLTAYAPFNPDSKTDTEPVKKQGKPTEEAVCTNAAPVAIAKANTDPRQEHGLGVNGTPSGADNQSTASIDQFDSSTNDTNVLFEVGTTDTQSPTPGKGKTAKQSTGLRTVNLDFLDNLSDDELPGQNSLGYSAMMGEQGQGKKKEKGKRQQESSAAVGSFSQLLQSTGGTNQMGGAKQKSNPVRPAPTEIMPPPLLTPFSQPLSTQEVRLNVRTPPPLLTPFSQPLSTQEVRLNVRKPPPLLTPVSQPLSTQEVRLNARKPPPLLTPFSQPLSTQEVQLNARKPPSLLTVTPCSQPLSTQEARLNVRKPPPLLTPVSQPLSTQGVQLNARKPPSLLTVTPFSQPLSTQEVRLNARKPPSLLTVTPFSQPLSTQEVRLNARKPPSLLTVTPFSQPLSTQEIRLNVRKDQHMYIAGPQKLHLQEIFNITRVVIEVPSAESYSEEIVLRGYQQQLGTALALMFFKRQIAQAQAQGVARWSGMSQPYLNEHPPLLIPFSQPLSTQEVRLNVRKELHMYIAGPQKLHLQEIFNITGVVIEVPSAESYSEEIVLHGYQQQLGAALTLMFSKSQLAQAQEAARWRGMLQPFFIQGPGLHAYQGHGNLQQQRSAYAALAGLNINENTNRPGAYGRGQKYAYVQRFTDCRKPVFEAYLTLDEVSHGLKRGSLIQGPIRINPKNFMEAYVPHPDGVSDVLILSIGNRNRALNGDIVAVFIEDQAEWQLNKEQLHILEEEQSLIAAGGLSENTIGEVKVTDSDAEVVIESEEIIELVGKLSNDGTKSGEEISNIAKYNTVKEESDIAKSESVEKNSDIAKSETVEKNSDIAKSESVENNSDIVKSESVEVNSDIAGKAGDITSSVKTVEKGFSDLGIEPSKPAEKADVQSNTNESKDVTKMKKPQTPNTDKKAKQSPYKRPDRFTSLREVMAGGSPVAKRLFGNQCNSEAGSHSEEGKKLLHRTGKVVAIIEQKHSPFSAGHIKPFQDKVPNTALFVPNDYRMQRIMVPIADCPNDFLERPGDHEKTLFIARLTEWKIDSQFAVGRLARSLGEAGEIEPETEAHLIENGVHFGEFPPEALDCLPKDLPWTIPASEIEKRRDFRDACVFTIDPATARDLDDALSCESLGDGKYKVGVHIADVSYFLDENTILDKVAAQRATSVYLVHKVIPMLPRLLCEQLCSLNPDEDRLSFSVEWTISENGEIEDEWFGRTVIRSCGKFSYDHAQGFLDQPDRDWTQEELPPISAPFTVEDIKSRVLALNKIATNLRRGRFEGGTLRLDQVKLQFTLDKETGLPNGYWVYHQKDSNRLIEEFMLLANMAVAKRINAHYPDKALLRRHPPPQEKLLEHLKDFCSSLGIHMDISTAGGINRSLQRYCDDDEYSLGRMQVLVNLCCKAMQNAKYFCNGCIDDESLYRHYALNVPLYTHFTSPIRRYADVLVHRVLAASLDYCADSARSPEEIHKQAEHCNDKKTAAKRVGDLSSDLFFGVFVKTAGPFEETAMVKWVLDNAFDIFVLKLGVTKRVYCDKLPLKEHVFKRERKVPSLTLTWAANDDKPEVQQEISIFSVVDCVLQPGELPLQWTAVIKRPQPPMMANVVPSEDE